MIVQAAIKLLGAMSIESFEFSFLYTGTKNSLERCLSVLFVSVVCVHVVSRKMAFIRSFIARLRTAFGPPVMARPEVSLTGKKGK